MAKGNKRQQKKQAKKTLQAQVRSTQQIPKKQVEKLSYNTLLSITEEQRKKEKKRQQQKQYRQNTRRKKVDFIESLGFRREDFTASQIDSIKMEDVKQGIYPDFFNRVYDFGDKGLYFAYRDFSWENSFEDILAMFENRSDKELVKLLHEIVRKKPTYNKGKYKETGGRSGGSSGSAGDYKFICADDNTIKAFSQDTKKENVKPTNYEWKQHSGWHKGFQELTSGGSPIIKKATPRRLLIVANAIMWNVTEQERGLFYKRFHTDIVKLIPEMRKILPNP